jgi:peptidoglycan hydrolase-like protein with peptidoglycan-binding domain
MVKRLTLTSVAATLMLLAATPMAPVSANDLGSKIGGAFTSAFRGLKDGMLGAYEDGTEGAKDLYGDAKAELTGQPRDPYKTAAVAPSGMRDDLVLRVQQELNVSGYASGAPDGIYGPQTASAVRAYQTNNGLEADGRVSVALYDHMRANPRRGSVPPPTPSGYTSYAPAPVTQAPVAAAPAAPAPTAGSSAGAPALPALPQTSSATAPVAGTTTGGQTCQPYESRTMVDGKEQMTAGTACLQPDGTWKRVN